MIVRARLSLPAAMCLLRLLGELVGGMSFTFCVCAVIHVFLPFQETVGKSLEEMNSVFDNESNWAFRVKSKRSEFKARLENTKREIEKGESVEHKEVQACEKNA